MKKISMDLVAGGSACYDEATIILERSYEGIVYLTEDEFTEMMMEDLKKVQTILEIHWFENRKNHRDESIRKNVENYMDQRWIKEKAAKYKTERGCEKFLSGLREKYEAKYTKDYDDWTIRGVKSNQYFDFDLFPGENGIDGCCCLTPESSEWMIRRCYQVNRNSKYFTESTGYMFGVPGDRIPCSTRPFLAPIISKELVEEYRAEERSLAKAISDFYKGCTYFGD